MIELEGTAEVIQKASRGSHPHLKYCELKRHLVIAQTAEA